MQLQPFTLLIALPVLLLGLISCSSAGGGGSRPAVVVSVTVAPHAVLGGGSLTATVVFGEDVSGLTADDLIIAGGTAGTFTAVDARTYTLAITAAETGATTVDVDLVAGAATTTAKGRSTPAARGQAAIAYAPWADGALGTDAFGVWADLTVSANGETAVQRFRLIPPGTFLMGSPTDEVGRITEVWHNFLPETQHQVTLTTPYWIADSECTQHLWKAVTNTMPSFNAEGGLQLPVKYVSWDSTQNFLAALNLLHVGLSARLPTEAEWEYAARAGTTTPFSIDVVSTAAINCFPYAGNPYVNSGVYRNDLVAVKSLPANAWGLHEVYGNVHEHCWDAGQHDLGSAAAVDPVGPVHDGTSSTRIMRGGGFASDGTQSRSAIRQYQVKEVPGLRIGFRMAVPNGPIGSG